MLDDHQGFASLVYRGDAFKTALTHYSNSAITKTSFDRTDISINNEWSFENGLKLNARLVESYQRHDEVSYQWEVNNRAVHSNDQSEAVKFQLGISY